MRWSPIWLVYDPDGIVCLPIYRLTAPVSSARQKLAIGTLVPVNPVVINMFEHPALPVILIVQYGFIRFSEYHGLLCKHVLQQTDSVLRCIPKYTNQTRLGAKNTAVVGRHEIKKAHAPPVC